MGVSTSVHVTGTRVDAGLATHQRSVWGPIVSVDDHVIEPPNTFVGRLPARLRDRTPRIVQADESEIAPDLFKDFDKWNPANNPVVGGGLQSPPPRDAWLIEGELHPIYGMDSCVGRPASEWSMRPSRYDDIIQGSWDVHARVRDMDSAGIYAALNFPSMWVGFCGSAFLRLRDAAFGQALVRAWNSWHLEEWAGSHPDRFIPLQLPMMWDVEVAAAEIRANAERGFRAVTFSENPAGQGLPSIHSGYWDPFFAACEETGTVVCLHAGSSGRTTDTTPDAPLEVAQSLFPVSGIVAAIDWVWSRVPVRFPRLAIALSEGGIGWLPLAVDWLEHVFHTHNQWTHGWDGVDIGPGEVLLRNFWFCTIEEPRGMRAVASTIGVDHVMVEVDYPHADSTWPRTRERLGAALDGLRTAEVEAVAWRNACALFRHPRPAVCGKHREVAP